MTHVDPIVRVDHWTTGLSDDALRGLAKRHAVRVEIGTQQEVTRGELVRDGWMIDVYGSRAPEDHGAGDVEETRHVHDVLHAIATAALPEAPRGFLIDPEPFTGAVVINPHHDFAEEVRMRIHVLREEGGREDEASADARPFTTALAARLAELGIRRD